MQFVYFAMKKRWFVLNSPLFIAVEEILFIIILCSIGCSYHLCDIEIAKAGKLINQSYSHWFCGSALFLKVLITYHAPKLFDARKIGFIPYWLWKLNVGSLDNFMQYIRKFVLVLLDKKQFVYLPVW